MKTDKIMEQFKQSLEQVSETEAFAKLVAEIDAEPQEGQMTVREFADSLSYKVAINEPVSFDNQRKVS
ncbi:hypothetical protein CGC53_03500 [Capnocytophaga leadbetteri]|uniref:Uncharacterized protein n=1 Tax=Capnocytophaga leadbetteri TaxID=327575 RepID=A0A250F8N0_9FLAO|nr:hypothetical protein CGC53_03500 [Capnocytophaga leadbetteri]